MVQPKNDDKFVEQAKEEAAKGKLKSLDSYVLIESLGKGTYGEAYLARDVRKDGSKMCVKVFNVDKSKSRRSKATEL